MTATLILEALAGWFVVAVLVSYGLGQLTHRNQP